MDNWQRLERIWYGEMRRQALERRPSLRQTPSLLRRQFLCKKQKSDRIRDSAEDLGERKDIDWPEEWQNAGERNGPKADTKR